MSTSDFIRIFVVDKRTYHEFSFLFPQFISTYHAGVHFLQALEKILHGLRKILQALRCTIQGFKNFSGGIFILFWCSARRAECVQIFL